eukprot:3874521-Rhodomonas_salina.5
MARCQRTRTKPGSSRSKSTARVQPTPSARLLARTVRRRTAPGARGGGGPGMLITRAIWFVVRVMW